jgi:hypothetical protein
MYRYYGSGSVMSADLKRVVHRVRTNRPELFAPKSVTISQMDGEGKVTRQTITTIAATALKPSVRHALSKRSWSLSVGAR